MSGNILEGGTDLGGLAFDVEDQKNECEATQAKSSQSRANFSSAQALEPHSALRVCGFYFQK